MPLVPETRAGKYGSMGLNRLDFQENMSKLNTDEAFKWRAKGISGREVHDRNDHDAQQHFYEKWIVSI